jgi:hypothetical protein
MFLHLPNKREVILQAVANTRFDKFRAKEGEKGSFHERPGGCVRFFHVEAFWILGSALLLLRDAVVHPPSAGVPVST